MNPTTGPAGSLWPIGLKTDFSVYISENDSIDPWTTTPSVDERSVVFGDASFHRIVELDVDIPESVRHNSTLYAHIFWGREDWKTKTDNVHDVRKVLYRRKLLTRYLPKKKEAKLKKLMSKSEEKEVAKEDSGDQILSYWYPNLTLCIVSDASPIQKSVFPAPVARHIHLVDDGRFYTPIFFVNDFWMLGEKLVAINDTTTYVLSF